MRRIRFGRWISVGIGAAVISCLAGGPAAAMPQTRHLAASNAGSIVYQSGNNVWVAAPNGTGRRQVTHNGTSGSPYMYPTQANNGTIEAERGYNTLYHLNRKGGTIGRALKVATGPSSAISLHSLALDPAISPNGQKVAVSVVTYQGLYDPSSGAQGADIIAQDVQYYNTSTGKMITKAHAAGTYLMAPSWVNNDQLLLFAPYNISAAEIYVVSFSHSGWSWFADGDLLSRQSLNHGELAPGKDKLAVIKGRNLKNDWRGTVIQLYRVTSLKSAPAAVCSLKAQHGAFGKVSWSPDGSTLAWSDSNGIWVSPVNPSASGCGLSPRLVISGGKNPDWGPVR